jgi:hypothetical protein
MNRDLTERREVHNPDTRRPRQKVSVASRPLTVWDELAGKLEGSGSDLRQT